MSFRGGGLPARAVGALIIVPFGAGLLIWPYGTLPLTALLIILAAREGAQIVGAISGGASAAWSATLLVVPLAALVAAGPVAAAMLWVLTLLTLVVAHLLRALRVKRRSVAPHARALWNARHDNLAFAAPPSAALRVRWWSDAFTMDCMASYRGLECGHWRLPDRSALR